MAEWSLPHTPLTGLICFALTCVHLPSPPVCLQIEKEGPAAPLDRDAFEQLKARAEGALAAAATEADASPDRALAGQAMKVSSKWQHIGEAEVGMAGQS